MAVAEQLGDLQIERAALLGAALQKQQAEFEAWTAAEREKIRERHRPSRAEFNVERRGARHEVWLACRAPWPDGRRVVWRPTAVITV